MSKSLKKILSLLLALVLLSTSLAAGISVYGEDEIVINSINFPDEEFEKYVRTLDKDASGSLSAQERNLSFMSITGYSILNGNVKMKNLKGIEFFASSLKTLRCSNLGLESLDVSALTNLTALSCMSNDLTALDVSNNVNLLQLDCTSNKLESLTFGNNTKLYELYCSVNKLTTIDVSKLTALADFKCAQNELIRLDVSYNTLLADFNCTNNHLRSLDLSRNTALVEISSANISNQTVSAEATLNNNAILVEFDIDFPSNVTSTSLDRNGNLAYSTKYFYPPDLDSIADGITYHYSVSNPEVEDMEVQVDVTRNFYQVKYYTDSNMTNLIDTQFVNSNGSATPPAIPDLPTCKALDRWSEDVSNVTADMNVYPILKDAHAYKLINFADGIATISCENCKDQYTVVFKDCINAQTGDSNYCEYIDVVHDGYINAKDFAELEKMFR